MSLHLSFEQVDQQIDVIHGYLSQSYWAEGIPRPTVEKAVANSLCVGAFDKGAQVGFARLITDRATFAYLADVFVLEDHRGKGIARAMLEALDAHPELQGLRRWVLFTRDMQPLYAQHGWQAYPHPERLMVRDVPEPYKR